MTTIKSIKIFVRYKHYLILDNRYRDTDDCFSTSMEMLGANLMKYPGLGAAVGYLKNPRQDLFAWLILEWTDSVGAAYQKEFPNVKILIDFLKENPPVAAALQYVPKVKG